MAMMMALIGAMSVTGRAAHVQHVYNKSSVWRATSLEAHPSVLLVLLVLLAVHPCAGHGHALLAGATH